MCYMRRCTLLCHVLNRKFAICPAAVATPATPLDPTHVMLNKRHVSRLRYVGGRISGRVAPSDKRIKFIILIIQRFDRRRSRAEPSRTVFYTLLARFCWTYSTGQLKFEFCYCDLFRYFWTQLGLTVKCSLWHYLTRVVNITFNKMLSYRRETALQGAL